MTDARVKQGVAGFLSRRSWNALMLRSLVWFLTLILTKASVVQVCPNCGSIDFSTPRYGFGGSESDQFLELWFLDNTGCTSLSMPASNNNISRCVVVTPSGCSPVAKAKFAQDAGAEAVVIVSDVPGAMVYLSGRFSTSPEIFIPVYAASADEMLIFKQKCQESAECSNQSGGLIVQLSATPNPWDSVRKISLVWRIAFPAFAAANVVAAWLRLRCSKGFFSRLFLASELIANTGRILAFSIDPYGWNGVLPNFAVSFFMGFPFCGAVLSSIVLTIYFRKLRVSVNLSHMKRMLVVCVVLLESFFIFILVASATYSDQFIARVMEQLIYGLIELTIAFWFVWEGVSIHRAISKSTKVTDEPGLRALTRKLASRLSISVIAMCLYSFLCLSVLLTSTPLNYICMVTIGQTAYIGISAIQISFFSSSRPRTKSRKVAEGARSDVKPEKTHHNKKDKVKTVKRKILLLGTGASGKSTIFKQAKLIYGQGYSAPERLGFRISIDKNIITSIKRLCQESRYYSPLSKSDLWQSAVFVCGLRDDERVTPEIAVHIGLLWASPHIQTTYHRFRHKFQLPADNLRHFFDHIKTIADPNYIPNEMDILYCRIPSASVRSFEFQYNGETFQITDVGGQRSERKKWKQCMEGVEEVLFVVALSEYNQLLFEDHYTNRLQDAFDVCAELLNSVPSKVNFSLILNKVDLFQKKVKKMDVPLPTAPPKISKNGIATAQWIYEQFRKTSRRGLWADYTIAIDSTDIKRVLDERLSRLFHSKKNSEVEKPDPQYPTDRLSYSTSDEGQPYNETDMSFSQPTTTATHHNHADADVVGDLVKLPSSAIPDTEPTQPPLPTLALTEPPQQPGADIDAPDANIVGPSSPSTTTAEQQQLVPTFELAIAIDTSPPPAADAEPAMPPLASKHESKEEEESKHESKHEDPNPLAEHTESEQAVALPSSKSD